MKVLVSAVGQRTEHWTDLFGVLAACDDVELTVLVADVSPLTIDGLERCAAASPRFRFHHLPHLLGEGHSGHMASILLDPRALRRLDLEQPDVVHVIGEAAYLSTAQVIGMARRRWPGIPITHYAAQNIVMTFPQPFPWLERRAYRAVSHFFPITPTAMAVLRRKGYRGGATIVPLGVDVERFCPEAAARPAGDRPFTIGFVGRMEVHKGIDLLLEAAAELGCALLVVGDGTQSDAVAQAAVDRPGLVTHHPWADHDHLPALLGQMDVLVLPSVEIIQRNVLPWVGIPLREQFGRVLVEAMACGVPVVGSDIGEIPYVIDAAGLTFPSGDRAALVEQLTRIRDDAELAAKLGLTGLQRAQGDFDWAHVARSMTHAWHGLCGLDRSGAPR